MPRRVAKTTAAPTTERADGSDPADPTINAVLDALDNIVPDLVAIEVARMRTEIMDAPPDFDVEAYAKVSIYGSIVIAAWNAIGRTDPSALSLLIQRLMGL